ncbi:MAG: hypothetical protein A3F67_06685 [Verrucomicrobia bacterium RIFCSPHIGHO2_12_FULL_41_10]|nr:MAG: hypothetical protein A3F67_06685 [Verrucomicrobia bacterium RIFCSPHIGHO2_12_FULL_41_10]HLB32645.1 inositol phosphate phosphatase SopB [Chthoniobacterales bacterium]
MDASTPSSSLNAYEAIATEQRGSYYNLLGLSVKRFSEPAPGLLGGRTVSTSLKQDSISRGNYQKVAPEVTTTERESISREGLYCAIKSKYGAPIAQEVNKLLQQTSQKSSSLSSRTIVQALDQADLLLNAYGKELKGFNPLPPSYESVLESKIKIYGAALGLLKKLNSQGRVSISEELMKPFIETIDDLRERIGKMVKLKQTEKEVYAAFKITQKDADYKLRTTKEDVLIEFKKILKASSVSTSEQKQLFSDFKNQLLNFGDWKILERIITTDQSGLCNEYTSTLIPASKSACLAKEYKEGALDAISNTKGQIISETIALGGVCSKDATNADHSINLWRDELRGSTEANASAKLLLSCIRSGVLVPIKIKDETARRAAADQRFNENLLMVLETRGDLATLNMSQEVRETVTLRPSEYRTEIASGSGGQPNLGSKENPIKLSISDIGLLSSSFYGEKKMQIAQFDYLSLVNNQPRPIATKTSEGYDITIWVKPQILAFNFGVQYLDRGRIGDATQPEICIKTNNESLDLLLGGSNGGGKAVDFLNHPKNEALPEKEKLVISRLLDQCRTMRENGTINAENEGDYYAFAARITLLCHKIGITPMVHCKSGKDRTSRLMEETKMLSAEVSEDVSVPSPGRLSILRQRMAIAFALGSGNRTIQELNTGHPGNKQGWQFAQRVSNFFAQIFYAGDSRKAAV